jgi:hypothetical protein
MFECPLPSQILPSRQSLATLIVYLDQQCPQRRIIADLMLAIMAEVAQQRCDSLESTFNHCKGAHFIANPGIALSRRMPAVIGAQVP